MTTSLEPIAKLTRDLVLSSKTLGNAEARFLVDAYYARQADRIRSDHQARTLAQAGEPNGAKEPDSRSEP